MHAAGLSLTPLKTPVFVRALAQNQLSVGITDRVAFRAHISAGNQIFFSPIAGKRQNYKESDIKSPQTTLLCLFYCNGVFWPDFSQPDFRWSIGQWISKTNQRMFVTIRKESTEDASGRGQPNAWIVSFRGSLHLVRRLCLSHIRPLGRALPDSERNLPNQIRQRFSG